jgi:uncharacterized protein DUF5317/MFS transporter/transketolase-like protein
MFLLPSLVLGVVFAVLLGGRPSRVADVRFRLSWTVLAALAVQFVIFGKLGESLEPVAVQRLHIASYVLLLAFAAANLRVRALVPVLLGLAANAVAIIANHGLMPVSMGAARSVGLSPGVQDNTIVADGTRLSFLGDVFALPAEFPLANVFSIGDILIGIGGMLFIVLVSIQDGGERALEPGRLLEPLRTRSYRVLAAGKLISHAGDWITLTALVGWIYESTGSTGKASLLLLARLAPPVLGGGIAALVVDRLPKQRLLVWIELARGAAVAGALFGIVSGMHSAVYVALAASGGLAAISNACVPSLLPSLLPTGQLASANAGLGIAKDGAMAVGALGSAMILSTFGVTSALVVDLGTFVASIVLFGLIRAPLRRGEERQREEGSSGGLRYVLGRRWLLVLVFSFAAATLATGLTNATLPRLLEDRLGFGAGGYGFGIASLAAGLALGQMLVGFARVGETAGRWIGAGLLVMAGLFGVLGLIDHGPTALLVLGAIGFVDGTTDVLFETVVQREADPRRYGAVFGFSYAFITATMMSAVALAPLVNGIVSPGVAILGGGALLVVAGAIALLGMPRTKAAATRPGGILREGADLSVVAVNGLGPVVEEAASRLAAEGVSVEVLELNGNRLWNKQAVLATVRKTSKVVVVHATDDGAEATELVAVIADQAFEDLDGPVRRVSAEADLAEELRDLAAF